MKIEKLNKKTGKMEVKNINYLYVATSKERYELPFAVADSIKELSEMTGVPAQTIRLMMTPSFKENRKYTGFERVYVGDEE